MTSCKKFYMCVCIRLLNMYHGCITNGFYRSVKRFFYSPKILKKRNVFKLIAGFQLTSQCRVLSVVFSPVLPFLVGKIYFLAV